MRLPALTLDGATVNQLDGLMKTNQGGSSGTSPAAPAPGWEPPSGPGPAPEKDQRDDRRGSDGRSPGTSPH